MATLIFAVITNSALYSGYSYIANAICATPYVLLYFIYRGKEARRSSLLLREYRLQSTYKEYIYSIFRESVDIMLNKCYRIPTSCLKLI